MELNLGSVEKKISNDSKYITAGINENVQVVKISEGASKVKSTPFINFRLVKKGGDPETEGKDISMYLTEKTMVDTLGKIADMVEAVFGEEKAKESMSIEELDTLMRGQVFSELKLVGRRYRNQEGVVKIAADSFPRYNFVRGEFSSPKLKITYDESKTYDCKPLEEVPQSSIKTGNDLPF